MGRAIVILIVAGGLILFLRACMTDDQRIEAATRAMPDDEKAFVAAVADAGGSRFIDANVLQLVPMRRERAEALCNIVKGGVLKDWVGRVETISATNRGDAILRVYLYGGGSVFLENWNERTDALVDKIPVPADTPAFRAVAALKPLDLIRFDGELEPSDTDCLRTSGTDTADQKNNIAATMMSPIFIVRWNDIRPLQ